MSNTKRFSLKKIAQNLDIRIQRLYTKVDSLSLTINEDGTIHYNDAITLVQSYVQSKKTSAETKQRAIELINNLNIGQLKLSVAKDCPRSESLINTLSEPIVHTTADLKWCKQFINNCTEFIKVLFAPITDLVQSILINSVQTLEGVHFKFVALIVAISVQMHHSAIWFQRVTPDENTSLYAAYGYAFMVDLFILVVTMEGKLSIAKTFASLTFLSNVLYFQFWVDFSCTRQAYTNAISSLLISGIMAYIIYAYTELFVKYRKKKLT